MELYVGGCFQGKLDYVCKKKKIKREEFVDEIIFGDCENRQQLVHLCTRCKGINHVHLLIQKLLKMQVEPQDIFRQIFDQNTNLILICDEVGYGIVPLIKEELIYREVVGRTMCMAAERAKHMERIIGGYGMVLKE